MTNINNIPETNIPNNINNKYGNLPNNNMQTLSEEAKTSISIIVDGLLQNNNNIQEL